MNVNESRSLTWFKHFLSLICLIIVLSIIIQDYSGYIPSCIFNRGQTVYYASSILLLVFFLALLGVLVFTKKKRQVFFVFMFFVMFSASELIIRVFDYIMVDHPNGIIGEYYNHESIILRRPTQSTNQLGFNEGYDYTKKIPANKLRLLFLGDSYTFGQGSNTLDNSYCKVVEKHLNIHSRQQFEVFNAGVPAYSPYDTYKLFKHLKKEGYQYDGVVFSLFIQNDFTEHIKNTERKSVGGVIYRFPENIILRFFHPLNSYLFRYAIFAGRLFKERINVTHGKANRTQGSTKPINEYMIAPLVFQRFQRNYGKAEKLDFETVYTSLLKMARESHVPFYIIIFPDQFYGNRTIKQRILQTFNMENYHVNRYYQWINKHLQNFSMLDITNIIESCHDCYPNNDEHLNDKGQILAGKAVGEYLLKQDWISQVAH